MPSGRAPDQWTEFHGGFRGSSLLRGGAVLIFLAALLNFFSQLTPADAAPSPVILAGWITWILGLWVLGAGFIWAGAQPALSRLGILVGLFFLLNGLVLLFVLFLNILPVLPPAALSLGRAMLLLVFAGVERKRIESLPMTLLVVSGILFVLKITLRLAGWMPDMGVPLDPALDALLIILMAAALFSLGGSIRSGENAWARDLGKRGPVAFSDFNNPEHEWNRSTK